MRERRGVPKSRSTGRYWYAEDLGNNGNMPRPPSPRLILSPGPPIHADFFDPRFFS